MTEYNHCNACSSKESNNFPTSQKRLKKSKPIGSFSLDSSPCLPYLAHFSYFIFGLLCIRSQFHKEETCKKNSETFFY